MKNETISVVVSGFNSNSMQTIELDSTVFEQPYSETLIHQALIKYIACSHIGTKKQKTRAQVSGGNSKPWPQKKRGLARAGSIRSPIFRKGGIVFAADGKPGSKPKLNRKMYRAAMASLFSELLRIGKLSFIEKIEAPTNKTKDFIKLLSDVKHVRTVFVLDAEEVTENLELATRNIPHVQIIITRFLNPYDLIKSDRIVATIKAARHIEKLLS